MRTVSLDVVVYAHHAYPISALISLLDAVGTWSDTLAANLVAPAVRTGLLYSSSMAPTSPLNVDTLLSLFNALLAWSCFLTFAIFLPAAFATKLDRFRSPDYVYAVFASRYASRTRSLVLTLLVISPTTQTR